MLKHCCTLFFSLFFFHLSAQTASLRGQLQGANNEALAFANLGVFSATDSSLAKAGITDASGVFTLAGLKAGKYYLKATYLGYADKFVPDLSVLENQQLDLGVVTLSVGTFELAEATITANRPMVEVKSDRMVFNVQGTINSTGADAISLMRKAPGVSVDNNDNISVLGRSGVLLYVDGKRLPLTGQDLVSYLQSLPAEQIDRIEIISNPGARYEAEGNAGIIDIRLKKDKSQGANGSLNLTASQGRYHRVNLTGSGNYRSKKLNVFGTAGYGDGLGFNNMEFFSTLNNSYQNETNRNKNDWDNVNYRVGADFFIDKKHTIGVLASGNNNTTDMLSRNRITLSDRDTPEDVYSILVADNTADNTRTQQTYNLNYRFDDNGTTFNVDVDYGRYENRSTRFQPNRYLDATETILQREIINRFNTPTDIDIYTLQADYETDWLGGKFGFGSKLSKVVSDNTFLYYTDDNGVSMLSDSNSNRFNYDEKVYAGYVNYARQLNKKWSFTAGLRAEQTDATGNLQAFLPELQKPPVELNYLSWFPSFGLNWQPAEIHGFAFNAGRRINRPDYNVLNPFNNRYSELSYEKGNPELQPEIVNNIELGYTLAYMYNFKLGYSRTTDQITRLIAPDDINPLASFISWANLAEQTIWSFVASVPVQITPKWNAYFNASASHIDNQADYGDGGIVDLQAFTYNIYQQHTFDLPGGFKAEISGYYNGPGIWGGVFVYESSWSLDLGLQRKFLNDRLLVRLSASDLFYETGWDGVSRFDGLESFGGGRWDSRRASISLGYRFGNDNVKSRSRSTSIEAEAGRVKE